MPLESSGLPAAKHRDPVLLCSVRTHRETLNRGVLAGIKVLSYSEDLLTWTQEDAEEGCMKGPCPLEDLDWSTIIVTR